MLPRLTIQCPAHKLQGKPLTALFATNPGLVPHPKDDRLWYLGGALSYWAGSNAGTGQQVIIVPRGFVTDLASVPRLFNNLIERYGRHTYAAVLHDWMYYCGDREKRVCDGIFLEAMACLRVPAWRRRVMDDAVLWFGGSAWNSHRKAGHCAATFEPFNPAH